MEDDRVEPAAQGNESDSVLEQVRSTEGDFSHSAVWNQTEILCRRNFSRAKSSTSMWYRTGTGRMTLSIPRNVRSLESFFAHLSD
jgi:hypothetical protein